MTKQQAINNIEQIFKNVVDTDDRITRSTKSLKIVLLNLQIEDAKLKEATAIKPIATRLEQSIDTIESEIRELIETNRKLLHESITILKGESDESYII